MHFRAVCPVPTSFQRFTCQPARSSGSTRSAASVSLLMTTAHASALPDGVVPKPGAKVDYGVADGRRGPQALSVKLLDPVPSVAKAARKPADDMAVIIEDLIKVLDKVGNDLRRGRYPERAAGEKYAALLRAVAENLEV